MGSVEGRMCSVFVHNNEAICTSLQVQSALLYSIALTACTLHRILYINPDSGCKGRDSPMH